MSKPTYKIIKDDVDPMKTVIQKGNMTAEFTLSEIQTEQKQLKTYIDQFKSKMSIEKAKVENIAHYHPFVLDLDDEQRSHVYLYQEAKVTVDACEQRIEEFEKQLKESEKEMALIQDKFNLRTPDVQEKIVDEAVTKIFNGE